MARDPEIWIGDALHEIFYLESFMAQRSKTDVFENETLYNAMMYSILKLTEACRRIPPELTHPHTNIPWSAIFSFGNRIRHEYFNLSDDRIWEILQADLGPLSQALNAINSCVKVSASPAEI